MNVRNIHRLAIPLLAGLISIGAAACGSSEPAGSGDVSVADAWIREPADGQTLAAGYGTITNGSDETITLVGASAPIAATLEIHETSVSDEGTMSMAEKEDGFDITAGESFTLEPGGAHIMMFDIDPTEISGSIDLTFVFDSTEVTVSAEVREIGEAMDDMGMGDGSPETGS